MLKLGKSVEGMAGTSTKLRSELLTDPKKKAAPALEEMEEDPTPGKFPKENTSPKSNTDKVAGLMLSPSSPTRELNHPNSVEMVEVDHSNMHYQETLESTAFMASMINMLGVSDSTTEKINPPCSEAKPEMPSHGKLV